MTNYGMKTDHGLLIEICKKLDKLIELNETKVVEPKRSELPQVYGNGSGSGSGSGCCGTDCVC